MATHRSRGSLSPNRGGFVVLGLIACVVAVATYLISTHVSPNEARSATRVVAGPHALSRPAHRAVRADATPTAAQFAVLFVTLSNLYGVQHNNPQRFRNADCVQASSGHYMCSYALVGPGHARECHLMQAEWTPNETSSFKVTLSGRVRRCATLKAALASLR